MTDSHNAYADSRTVFVSARGSDSVTFLNGQFSHDVSRLGDEDSVFGAFCTPKGRAMALAGIARTGDGLLIAVDRSLGDDLIAALSRYVMRADVRFDRLPRLAALGFAGAAPDAATAVFGLGRTRDGDETPRIAAVTDDACPVGASGWELALIRAGRPTLDRATAEAFVPQMLNLDLIDGISFTKGCYTGQEIVARTQNLGSIKRRMLGFSAAAAPPPPGSEVLDDSGAVAGKVVSAAATRDGCELLAVMRLAAAGGPLVLAGAGSPALRGFDLPYPIPELSP